MHSHRKIGTRQLVSSIKMQIQQVVISTHRWCQVPLTRSIWIGLNGSDCIKSTLNRVNDCSSIEAVHRDCTPIETAHVWHLWSPDENWGQRGGHMAGEVGNWANLRFHAEHCDSVESSYELETSCSESCWILLHAASLRCLRIPRVQVCW